MQSEKQKWASASNKNYFVDFKISENKWEQYRIKEVFNNNSKLMIESCRCNGTFPVDVGSSKLKPFRMETKPFDQTFQISLWAPTNDESLQTLMKIISGYEMSSYEFVQYFRGGHHYLVMNLMRELKRSQSSKQNIDIVIQIVKQFVVFLGNLSQRIIGITQSINSESRQKNRYYGLLFGPTTNLVQKKYELSRLVFKGDEQEIARYNLLIDYDKDLTDYPDLVLNSKTYIRKYHDQSGRFMKVEVELVLGDLLKIDDHRYDRYFSNCYFFDKGSSQQNLSTYYKIQPSFFIIKSSTGVDNALQKFLEEVEDLKGLDSKVLPRLFK